MDGQKGVVAGRRAGGAPGVEMVGERHTVATHRHDSTDLKGNLDVMENTNAYIVLTVLPSVGMCLHSKCSIRLIWENTDAPNAHINVAELLSI